MADTGQSINYNLRFAKHIERKMLADAFLELAPFENIKKYRYVGFGSFYFNDFTLFHKRLGMASMLSIEGIKQLETRCKKNIPFNCVELVMGEASKVLKAASFSWHEKTILWLDYDKRLQDNYLEDVAYVCPRLSSGSILLVTINAHPGRDVPLDGSQLDRVESMRTVLSERYIPLGLKHQDLSGWKTAEVYRGIIDAVIKRVLSETFGDRPEQDRLVYQQLFNFHYNDGAQMLTIGGILFKESDRPLLDRCQFKSLNFIREDREALLIDIPNLTYREMKHLDSILPLTEPSSIPASIVETHGIPIADVERYANVYRFFPTFADVDI